MGRLEKKEVRMAKKKKRRTYLVKGKLKGKPLKRIVRTTLGAVALGGAIRSTRILSDVVVRDISKLKK